MTPKEPVFITGCQRSGLSMVAGVFNCCGAYLGDSERGPRQDAFENTKLIDELVLPYMRLTALPVDGSSPSLSLIKTRHWIMPSWEKRVSQVIGGNAGDGVWAFKNYRIALMWRQWAKAFPNAHWVLVRRDQADLANSCIKTGYMKQFSSIGDWVDWAEGWSHLLDDIESNVQERVHRIWPFKFFQEDFSQARAAVEAAGLIWNDLAVRAVLPQPKQQGSK